MKTAESSKNAVIRRQSELIHQFRQLIDDEPDLHWKIRPNGPADDVRLKLDNRSLRFKPVYSLKPGIPELESVVAEPGDSVPPLLITPELNSRVLDFCREHRLAAVDLNGRVYLRAEGLLVDRQGLPGRSFRYEFEPRNVFVGKSASIVRTLLTDRDHIWTQSELVKRTEASSGLVSRIVRHLINQGFLEKHSARELRLRDPLGLIDAWAKADDFNRRASTARYTVFGDNPLETAQRLNTWAKEQHVPMAFTQWIAGWLRFPYTEPVITSAYVSRLPDAAVLERLGLRPVSDAGKVWLFVPEERGVFLEIRLVQGLPLASDAQIYIDLQGAGLRGPEQAEALRNSAGFCRP